MNDWENIIGDLNKREKQTLIQGVGYGAEQIGNGINRFGKWTGTRMVIVKGEVSQVSWQEDTEKF